MSRSKNDELSIPNSLRPILEVLKWADRVQGGVEGLTDLIAGLKPWERGLADCVEYICEQRILAEDAAELALAECEFLRDALRTAADDLDKAANQFESANWPGTFNGPKFAEKAARARAAAQEDTA